MVILSTILLFFSSLTGQPSDYKLVIPADTSFSSANKDTVKNTKKDTITIIGVGDIMIGTTYPSPKYLPPDDGKHLLAPVADILRDADITFGNHEGTFLNGKGIPKKCKDSTKCYAFKSPEHYANYLVDAGFDLISVANNHFGDFGEPGRQTTIKVLQDAGLKCAGSLTLPYTILEKDGVKYGLAAFSPNTGTCSINDHELARKTVAHLDTLTDIVIVSFHGGAEGKNYQHVTRQTEMFYGENRGNVYKFAHEMIDAGADIIFGHGPHVTRAVEVYKERFIAYSLGNFCTYARFNLKGENGIAPIVKVFTNSEGKFLQGQIYPVIQLGEGGPVMDDQKRVIFKMKELTETDFPDAKIKITETGQILLR